MRFFPFLIIASLVICCRQQATISLHEQLKDEHKIAGKPEYIKSPFVTAGDRLYVVGHQDGTFPDLGWHVTGEMGGVWNHPVKLLDGYRLALGVDDQPITCLPQASKFYNYPMASQHIYPTVAGVSISSVVAVPDGIPGVIVEYELINTMDDGKELQLSFEVMTDLMPVWLSERKGIVDGKDSGYWDRAKDQLVVKDSLNTWFTLIGSSNPIEGVISKVFCSYNRKGLGEDYSLRHQLSLDAGERKAIQYYIAGSYTGLEEAETVLNQMKTNASTLIDEKKNRMFRLNQAHQLITNDKQLDKMYEWVRYNTDWLMREVPEEGRGLSAGIPDYPWWFGTDNGYAIEGMLAYGMFEEAVSTIDLIFKLSDQANGVNGQVMHEASTNGIVYNPGNLNTTPRFVSTLWNTYRWIGSDSLLQAYWPRVQKAMEWIEAQDHDGNGYPDGPGMMEIQGLHTEMVDVVAYQEQAYRHAASFANAVGEHDLEKLFQSRSQVLKVKINSDWWSNEFQSYADFRATKSEAIELTEAAIIRADTLNKFRSKEELEFTLDRIKKNVNKKTDAYVVHHNWVVNTPLETGAADEEKAELALKTAKKFSNRFGMFVTGIDRDDQQEEATQWKSFSYVGAVMTLPTAVQAIGSGNYGQINDTFSYLNNLQNSFSYALPGSMYEVSPDFGMIVQAWNAYAVAVPIVQYIVGIDPEAHLKQIKFNPQLPKGIDELELKRIKIGGNVLDVKLVKEGAELIATVTQSDPDYRICIKRMKGVFYTAEHVAVNPENDNLILSGPNIIISWR
ncbi:MAG: glycosyl hydrolase family 65 protein [Cyclobacteriaceae bacterium]